MLVTMHHSVYRELGEIRVTRAQVKVYMKSGWVEGPLPPLEEVDPTTDGAPAEAPVAAQAVEAPVEAQAVAAPEEQATSNARRSTRVPTTTEVTTTTP